MTLESPRRKITSPRKSDPSHSKSGPRAQPASRDLHAGPVYSGYGETPSRKQPKELKIELGELTDKNIMQLRKLNLATFPVVYQDHFYRDMLFHTEFSRLGVLVYVLLCYCFVSWQVDKLVRTIPCKLRLLPGCVGFCNLRARRASR
jgi:hypothetical protein